MVDFPTKRQRGPSSYVAEVTNVEKGFVANYGPQGRDGLYIHIKYESTGKPRQIFYPDPPSMKTDKLLEQLELLGIDLDALGGWDKLIGMNFRWATETVQREIFDRETSKKINRSVQLEFPAELLEGAQAPVGTTAAAPTAVGEAPSDTNSASADTASTSEEETFKDHIVEILAASEGLSLRQLRMKATERDDIRAAPLGLREALSRGQITDTLVKEGRLLEEAVDDPEEGSVSVFKLAL